MNIKVLSLLLLLVALPGCSLFGGTKREPLPPVKIITEVVQAEIFHPPVPSPAQIEDVTWFVVTAENLDEKIAELQSKQGEEWVLFGFTPQAYENMAYNIQEMRRYNRQLQELILYYMEATRPRGTEEWLQENENRASKLEDAMQPDPEEPGVTIEGIASGILDIVT